MTDFQRWRDELILREMETVGPEPKQTALSGTGPWTPAALERLLADAQASPATAEIDRYLHKQTAEKYAGAQLKVHGLRSHNNGLVADLAIARESNSQLARERAALTLELARWYRPWWRRAWEWVAEFVAVITKAQG